MSTTASKREGYFWEERPIHPQLWLQELSRHHLQREREFTPVEKTKKFQGWCHRTGTRRKSVSPGRLATPIGSADLIFLSLGRPRLCKGGFLSSSAPVTHPLVPAGRASSALSVTPCITGSGGRDGDTNPKRVGGDAKKGTKNAETQRLCVKTDTRP